MSSRAEGYGGLESRFTEMDSERYALANNGMMDRKGDNSIEVLRYKAERVDGSTRNMSIRSNGRVVLLGMDVAKKLLGDEEENGVFTYTTTLEELGCEEVAGQLEHYHEDSRYEELDEILRLVEYRAFNRDEGL